MQHLLIKEICSMPTLLKLDSSPMGDHSVSRKLTAKFVEAWRESHPGARVVSRDLSTTHIPIVDGSWIGAAYTPEAGRSPDQRKALALSDELFAELLEADELVLGVPMHNFGIPSSLKLWIDQVIRVGKTFAYDATGPKGLLKNKKATLLIASGGAYGEGTAMASLNFVSPYLRAVFGFVGIADVTIIAAEGTSQIMQGAVDPQAFLAPLLERVETHASL
jgi:FMN-dependent NADH-azoreductase